MLHSNKHLNKKKLLLISTLLSILLSVSHSALAVLKTFKGEGTEEGKEVMITFYPESPGVTSFYASNEQHIEEYDHAKIQRMLTPVTDLQFAPRSREIIGWSELFAFATLYLSTPESDRIFISPVIEIKKNDFFFNNCEEKAFQLKKTAKLKLSALHITRLYFYAVKQPTISSPEEPLHIVIDLHPEFTPLDQNSFQVHGFALFNQGKLLSGYQTEEHEQVTERVIQKTKAQKASSLSGKKEPEKRRGMKCRRKLTFTRH